MDKLEDIERLLYEKEDNKKDTVSEKNNKHKKEDKVVNKIPESYLTPGYQKTVQVGIKKLYPDVVAPEYKHDGDACCANSSDGNRSTIQNGIGRSNRY